MHNAPRSDKRARVRTASGLLLAAACSGLIAPAGNAALINNEAPGDYGNDLASATNLGAGVAVVNGSVTNGSDFSDYFKVTGLTPGSTFTIPVSLTITSGAAFYETEILNSSGGLLDVHSASSNYNATLSGTVPGDGILIGFAVTGEGSGGGNYSYSNIPEPGSAGLLAAGALALLAKRKRNALTGRE